MKSFLRWEGIRAPIVLVCGNLHTASFVCHTWRVVPLPLGKALDVSVDEELCVFLVVLLVTSCCCWYLDPARQSSIGCWAWCLSFLSHSLMFIAVTSHLFLVSKSLLRVVSVFSPLTKSFRSSSHLLAGLPALH